MIGVPAEFATANESNAKKPIFRINIDPNPVGDGGGGGGGGGGSDPNSLDMQTTSGTTIVQPGGHPTYGSVSVGATSGVIELDKSHSLSFFGQYPQWSFSPAGKYGAPGSDDPDVPTRDHIVSVKAVMSAYQNQSYFCSLEYSVDDGATWHAISSSITTTETEFSVNITSALTSEYGSMAAADFSKIKLRAFITSSLNIDPIVPPELFNITNVAVRVTCDVAIDDGGGDPGGGDTPFTGGSRVFYTKLPVGLSTLGVERNAWITSIDDLALTVNDMEGSAELGDLVFHVLDRNGLLTADFPNYTYEGKRVRLYCGFEDLDESFWALLFTGKVDNIASDENNNTYVFTCPDIRTDLSKVIYGTADDGFPTDKDHPRTLNGHPLDILLAALKTEVGYIEDNVDTATIEAYRDGIFAGRQFKFVITSPPEAREFITKEIMLPLGGYIYPKPSGAISVHFFYPRVVSVDDVPPDSADLTNNQLLEIPLAEQAPMFNQVVCRYDYSDDDKPLAEVVRDYPASQTKYGLIADSAHIIESHGMRGAFQGAFLSALIAYLIFLRYGLKTLQMENVRAVWKKAFLEPGDQPTMTQPNVPDRTAGVRGVTDMDFEVLDRTWTFGNCTVTYRVIAIPRLQDYKVAPNGTSAFTGASADEKQRYMFLSNDDGAYSDLTPGNTLA